MEQKIIFVFLFFFSVFFASNVCTNLTLFKYETQKHLLVENITEALKENVTIYDLAGTKIKETFLKTSIDNINYKYYKKIGEVMKECHLYDDISKFDNFIIVIPDTYDSVMISRRSDESKKFKTIETNFPPFLSIFYFEEYSPFLKKYYLLQQQFFENGMKKKNDMTIKNEIAEGVYNIFNPNNDTLIITLITVLITGFFISLVIFIYENILISL